MHIPTKLHLALLAVVVTACAAPDGQFPMAPVGSSAVASSASSGPENPPFNLEVLLRGEEGFGLVRFRQPNDGSGIVNLDVWVRDLAPNTNYLLQRAVDRTLDGACTSTSWLTLGRGLVPQAITTDERGTAGEHLFRNLSAFAPGTTFDIHFRVVVANTSEVVLRSECYMFTVR